MGGGEGDGGTYNDDVKQGQSTDAENDDRADELRDDDSVQQRLSRLSRLLGTGAAVGAAGAAGGAGAGGKEAGDRTGEAVDEATEETVDELEQRVTDDGDDQEGQSDG